MVVPFYERENESTFVKSLTPFSYPYLPRSAFSFGVFFCGPQLMTRQQFRDLVKLTFWAFLNVS